MKINKKALNNFILTKNITTFLIFLTINLIFILSLFIFAIIYTNTTYEILYLSIAMLLSLILILWIIIEIINKITDIKINAIICLILAIFSVLFLTFALKSADEFIRIVMFIASSIYFITTISTIVVKIVKYTKTKNNNN